MDRAYIGWYNSLLMHRDKFKEALTKLYNDYDIEFATEDFNARHPPLVHYS